SQPLSSKSDTADEEEDTETGKAAAERDLEKKAAGTGRATTAPAAVAAGSTDPGPAIVHAPPPAAPAEVRVVQRPMRRRLADTRASITHKFNIAGHEGYLTVGLYEDGMPGELFI